MILLMSGVILFHEFYLEMIGYRRNVSRLHYQGVNYGFEFERVCQPFCDLNQAAMLLLTSQILSTKSVSSYEKAAHTVE
jgi:hypothetical protein